MSCGMRGRLIEEGPEGMASHVAGCERCQADVDRLEGSLAALWDDLDDFVEASDAPLVVAPVVATPPAAPVRGWWLSAVVALAAAAVLASVLWPAAPGSTDEVESDAAQPQEAVEERAPLPLDGELDAADVAPLIGGPVVEAPPETRDAPAPAPAPPPCPEAGAWWRLESPMPADCVDAFVVAMGAEAHELHLVFLGERAPPSWDVEAHALRRFAADEVARLSHDGRPGDATLLAARVTAVPVLASRSVYRTGALAGREWAATTSDPEEARRRQAIAYRLAQGWVDSYQYENSVADLLAVTVRDSLAGDQGEGTGDE